VLRPIFDAEKTPVDELYFVPLKNKKLIECANKFAIYFCREIGCTKPYVETPGADTYLLMDYCRKDFKYMFVVFGCLQVINDETPLLSWIWIHPYQRSLGYGKKILEYLSERYPGLELSKPYSKSMRGLLERRQKKND
jgi:hypothetical protein